MYFDRNINGNKNGKILQGNELFKGGNYSRAETIRGNTVYTVQFRIHEKKARGSSKVMLNFTKNLFYNLQKLYI